MPGYYHRWSGRSTAQRDPSFVPKNHQEYQNISNNIELYRNPECPKKRPIFSGFTLLSALYVFPPLPPHG
jgi:hypothetical protein